MAKNGSATDSFRESLLIDGDHWDFETKQELQILMTDGGYRTVKEEGVLYVKQCTPKQVDYAWNLLREKSIQETIDNYIVHTYNKRIILRATQNQTINGKQYRKGQFLPKKRD